MVRRPKPAHTGPQAGSHRRVTPMPLPKLPNRPAAILTFPSGDTARAKAARTNSKPAVAGNTDEPLLQPE
ncbi:hypothetical protein, partial [Bordetella pertussis]|uniref:hypothetical protein n=1 Tax=Bordetella pertussis TaxID=520 RepID=UPI0039EE156F